MSNWIDVINVADFPPHTWQVVECNDLSLLVFNIDGEYYAIENMCTHDGGTLADGCLQDDEIICPRHGARFSVRTGAVTQPPAYEDIRTFPVRVHENKVQVLV